MTEIKKVVIPKFVAELLESEIKDIHDVTFFGFVKLVTDEGFRHNESIEGKVVNWITEKGNESKLMRAWLDGYEVEKEKLYYVKLPVSIWNEHLEELETKYGYLKYDITSDETKISLNHHGDYRGLKVKLTEETIKSIDERYWAFAVEVEGEE
nr:DUF1642 domain-containing protein [Carnobacterium maltaromaticum]